MKYGESESGICRGIESWNRNCSLKSTHSLFSFIPLQTTQGKWSWLNYLSLKNIHTLILDQNVMRSGLK